MKVGTGKSWRSFRDNAQIHIFSELFFKRVYFKYSLAVVSIGKVYDNASVKPSGTHKCGIKNVTAISCRHHNHLVMLFESVHFNQYLIKCLLAFVIAATDSGSAHAADRANLINKYNSWRSLLREFEEVAYARSADTDKKFNELRAGYRKEGYARLASHRTREKCLSGAGRAHEKHAFRNFRADIQKLLLVLQ